MLCAIMEQQMEKNMGWDLVFRFLDFRVWS